VEWADRHRDVWGAKLHEMYGSSQMGSVVASTCERGLPEGTRGVLHVHDWATIVEVLDPETSEPVAPGEEGELVLTPFYRRATPLLRYRTGDRVRYLPPGSCPCGRPTIGIESGTISRYDDMFKIKLKNIWASEVDQVILDELGAREYQANIYLDDRGREQVAVTVFGGGVAAPDVSDALRRAFGINFHVTAAAAADAPVFDVKPKRWHDQRMAN
jgi:phenylacetate-CoA ligase